MRNQHQDTEEWSAGTGIPHRGPDFGAFLSVNTSAALVQSDGGRSVIGIPGQIGLSLSYVIDPLNPKMRAMIWNCYD